MWRPKRFTTITPTASNAVPSRSRFRASPWGVTLRASNAKYANTRNSTARLTKYTASLGVLSHFSSIARGVIDLRDAVYFVSLAVLFLVFAYFALLARKVTPQGEALKRLRLGTALLAVGVIVVNLFGRHIGGRIDLT